MSDKSTVRNCDFPGMLEIGNILSGIWHGVVTAQRNGNRTKRNKYIPILNFLGIYAIIESDLSLPDVSGIINFGIINSLPRGMENSV